MLDTSKLLGFSAIGAQVDNCNPYISAKIGFAEVPPINQDVFNNPSSSAIYSNVSDNSMILDLAGQLDNTTGDGKVSFFFPPSQAEKDRIADDMKLKNNIWTSVSYGNGQIDDDGAINGYDYDSFHLNVGTNIYESVEQGSVVGLYAGYIYTDSEINNTSSSGSETDYFQIGLYGKQKFSDNLALVYAGSIGYADVETERNSATGIANGDTDGFGYNLGAEISYDLFDSMNQDFKLVPFASLQAASIGLDDYTETGDSPANVELASVSQLYSTLGIKASTQLNHFGNMSEPFVKLGWTREYLDDEASSNSVLTGGVLTSSSSSPDTGDDFLKINALYPINFSEEMALSLSYAGLHNSDVNESLLSLSFGYRW